ncbi:hypothetical protein BH18ACT5_BH18ACT5_18590 [soil metagenome]
MRFNGRLQTDAESESWLKSELSISGNKVELSSGDDLLGSWPVGQVKAERVEGDRFELFLGDDRAMFAADDALAFSYEALPKLTKKPIVEAAQGFRKFLGGGRKAAALGEPLAPVVVESEPEPDETPSEPVPANVKRLRELIEVAKANRPEEFASARIAGDDEFQMTESRPIEEAEPGPLWSMTEAKFTPETSFNSLPVEEPRPIALSIVEAPVDLAPAFNDESALADEIDRLAQQVKAARLTPAQTEAAIGLIRSLRTLLNR